MVGSHVNKRNHDYRSNARDNGTIIILKGFTISSATLPRHHHHYFHVTPEEYFALHNIRSENSSAVRRFLFSVCIQHPHRGTSSSIQHPSGCREDVVDDASVILDYTTASPAAIPEVSAKVVVVCDNIA